jgi:flagellar biosynthesis component FlhA
MRKSLAVVGATVVVLALVIGRPEVAVVGIALYVVWMVVRIPIERRDRLRQVDPGWHRDRHYDETGEPTDD